jgi:hypothetical protein
MSSRRITVADDGEVVISSVLAVAARGVVGLDTVLRVRCLPDGHRGVLPWHQEKLFKVK